MASSSLKAPPSHVAELALACEDYVRRAVGAELDYTPDTLPILDEYIRKARENVFGTPAPVRRPPLHVAKPAMDAPVGSKEVRPGNPREEIVRLVAPAVGAYFGEVLRRAFECRWHAPGSAYSSWRLEFARCFLFFNPIGIAVEAIQLQDTDGLGAAIVTSEDALAELRVQLERAAPVRVEDYYSLSTRFEVIDQVVHFLMVRSRQLGPREYDGEFYREQAKEESAPEA